MPELLTPDELAELLRLSPRTIYELLQTGEIPGAKKVGRAWRIHRDTVLEWIKGGERE